MKPAAATRRTAGAVAPIAAVVRGISSPFIRHVVVVHDRQRRPTGHAEGFGLHWRCPWPTHLGEVRRELLLQRCERLLVLLLEPIQHDADNDFPARLIEPVLQSRARLMAICAAPVKDHLAAPAGNGVLRKRRHDLISRHPCHVQSRRPVTSEAPGGTMHKSRIALGLVLAVGLSLCVSSLAVADTDGADGVLSTTLRGIEEVPGPGDPNGKGAFTATLSKDTMCYSFYARRISAPVAAHIHDGDRDTSGPVVITFLPDQGRGGGVPDGGTGRRGHRCHHVREQARGAQVGADRLLRQRAHRRLPSGGCTRSAQPLTPPARDTCSDRRLACPSSCAEPVTGRSSFGE